MCILMRAYVHACSAMGRSRVCAVAESRHSTGFVARSVPIHSRMHGAFPCAQQPGAAAATEPATAPELSPEEAAAESRKFAERKEELIRGCRIILQVWLFQTAIQ